MKANPTPGEAAKLRHDIGHSRVVQENSSRLEIRRMHGDVERAEPVLEYALDVFFLDVRERREIPVREGQAIVVVADIEIFSQARRQPLDETELAAVRAAADVRRDELDAKRLSVEA